MDLEDICVQLKNRYRDRDVEFQGRLVRLNKKDSVCRQLYDIWLDTSDREATYEDFKRSLRFDREGGRVEVKFAYDPTKFVVAGLAGIGAAAGGYHWWKSKKKSAGSSGPRAPSPCVKPNIAEWTDVPYSDDIYSLTFEITQGFPENVKSTRNTVYSTEKVKRIHANGIELNQEQLAELERLWDENEDSEQTLDHYEVDESGHVVKQMQYGSNNTKLDRPDPKSEHFLIDSSLESRTDVLDPSDSIVVNLKPDVSICKQVEQTLVHGTITFGSELQNNNDLYEVKSRFTMSFSIPSSNRWIKVHVKNNDTIQNIPFEGCAEIKVGSKTYQLKAIRFEDDTTAVLENDKNWVLILDRIPYDNENFKAKTIPNNDLSKVCQIPTFAYFKADWTPA